MKKKELESFRKLLIEKKTKILRHLDDLSASSEADMAEGGMGDPVDIASTEITQASLQKIGKRETYLLKKIDLALHKIDDGTYGECESCGEDIDPRRLMARPEAQLCIDCKTEQENVERKFSSRDLEESDDDTGYEEGEEY